MLLAPTGLCVHVVMPRNARILTGTRTTTVPQAGNPVVVGAKSLRSLRLEDLIEWDTKAGYFTDIRNLTNFGRWLLTVPVNS